LNLFRRGDKGEDDAPEYRYILMLADLHVGHAFGMMPDGYTNSAGNGIELNVAQRYLWDCWQDLLEKLPQRIDTLLLVGDMVEGQNVAEEARGLSEVDPFYQINAAAEILAPVVSRVPVVGDNRNVYIVAGSKYHVGHGREHLLGKRIQAVPRNGRYAPMWRHIIIDDVLIELAHHQSFTIRYATMPLEREYGFELERTGRRREALPPEVVIVRAHTHKGYRAVEERGALCVSLPAMKLQDDYAAGSKYPNRLVPDNLGAAALKIYREPVDGYRVHPARFLYDHPAIETEVVRFE